MKLMTTKEFSLILEIAYGIRGYNETLASVLYSGICDHKLTNLLQHAKENGIDMYYWENDLAVIRYCITNFVEDF